MFKFTAVRQISSQRFMATMIRNLIWWYLMCQSNDMNGKDLPGLPTLASFNHVHIMLGRCTKPSDDLNHLNQGHKPLEASPKETQDLFQLSTSILRISWVSLMEWTIAIDSLIRRWHQYPAWIYIRFHKHNKTTLRATGSFQLRCWTTSGWTVGDGTSAL